MSRTPDRIFVIAEAGVNHNGSLELAMQLVDAAASAGADAVKFQTFKAECLISRAAPKADYQIRTTGDDESQLDMVKRLEIDEEAHRLLIRHCSEKGLQFLSTPFDSESLSLLVNTFDMPMIKLPSGEITNAPFLLEAAETGKPVILSTGMSTMKEVERALGVLAFGYMRRVEKPSRRAFRQAFVSEAGRRILKKKVTLLHCTTAYPAPFEDIHLRAMNAMRSTFSLPVGYSDHTPGISVSIAAAALGAAIIEKHFTLNRDLPGPDHKASLEPHELKTLVASIRQVEIALGSPRKRTSPSEIKNRDIARKSLVAASAIKKNEVFSVANLAAKRPGTGISPDHYWELLGKKARRKYREDDLIKE